MAPRVKICGLSTEAALDAAIAAGADLVGLVHFAKSPRHVTVERAAELAAHARAVRGGNGARVVVLLVDPDDALVQRVAAEVKPDMLQLHGHETPMRVREIVAASGLPVLKAVAVATDDDVDAALAYRAAEGGADMLLFDAKPPADARSLPGGNGLSFDWHILERLRGTPFALAGGLTPDSVAAAIALTGAAIVDVSSGVESRPGEKSPELIRRFLQAAKAAKEA